MRRLLIAVTAALSSAVIACAQYGPGFHPGPYGYGGEPFQQRRSAYYERDVDFGIALLGGTPNTGYARDFGLQVTGEWRGYINDLFDVGFQMSFAGGRGAWTREDPVLDDVWNIQMGWEGLLDINFIQYYNLTVFGGFGVGRGYGYCSLEGLIRGWLFNPRIGIELFDRFRITGEFKILAHHEIFSYSAIGISWALDPYRLMARRHRDREPRR